MKDVSVGPGDIERQNNLESAHMICLDLDDEKYDVAEEIPPTQNISMHPDSQKSMFYEMIRGVKNLIFHFLQALIVKHHLVFW